MKKCCKDIDITDAYQIEPFIEECIKNHGKRHDFSVFIKKEGLINEYRQLLNGNISARYEIAIAIAKKIATMIKARNIPVLKTWAKERYDDSSQKMRLIGNETVLQRFLDYIVVYGCHELWHRKLVREQCSSIKGRGQLYGVKLLRKYILKDNQNMRWAVKHHIRYIRKCKYFVKLDIRHCYESIDKTILMNQLIHDIKNSDMVYLWKSLLGSYTDTTNGLLIGALPSQYASQYIVANLYRKAMSNPSIMHMATYMDDMILFASNRRKLLKAVKALIVYARDTLHLTIKSNFAIKKLENEPIDMMGYVLHANGKITIRARGFIHARRLLLRYERQGYLTISQSKRIVSYKGYFKQSNSYNSYARFNRAFRYAQKVISKHERNKKHGTGSNIICNAAQNYIPANG